MEVIPVREMFWEMVSEAAQDEADAVGFYRRMAEIAPCRAMANSIEDIARDEMRHLNYFESLLCSRQERGKNHRGRRRRETAGGRTLTIPTIPDPYPSIQVECPNPEYARLLLDDYAGMVSEMTAINQYLFHHFDMPQELADVAQMLEDVAIVEMHHLEILAELINLLGQPPMYMDGQGLFWNASYVPYLTGCPCEQLKSDIQAEQIAIETYRRHMELIDDRYIKEILARIIMDEELHLHLFSEAYKTYCSGR